MFVDYSGVTVPWVDASTGEVHQAEVFVGVLGASNYTFVRAYPDQTLPNWLDAHRCAFEYIGGVTQCVVPDNLKSGVTKAHRYDPDINPSYQDLAIHYQTAVLPTRARAPKDKAKVEVGVQGVQRWILAPLRHRKFFSIHEINAAIKPLLEAYNDKPMQELQVSRRTQYELLDRPKLKPLPNEPYEFADWKKVKAGIDYHVAIEKHYYSVPHQFCHVSLDCRITRTSIECFYQGKRLAHHQRRYKPGHTTLVEHMPESHSEYLKWTPERLQRWGKRIGPKTSELITEMIKSRDFPQQAFRGCLGVLRLSEKHGSAKLEATAARALALHIHRYKDIVLLIEKDWSRSSSKQPHPVSHDNIRGQAYFNINHKEHAC